MSTTREKMIVYRKKRLEKLSEVEDKEYIDLDSNQENELLSLLYDMSISRKNLLIFKNYYNHTFEEVEDILNIENVKGEYINFINILSENLKLDNKAISDKSIKKASIILAEKMNDEVQKDLEEYNKTNKIRFKNYFHFNKMVASFAIAILLASTLLITANVYAEGRIFSWIINTFDNYSIFNISENDIVNKENRNISINYLPDRFELVDEDLSNKIDDYYYEYNDEYLAISFIYNDKKTYLSIEGNEELEFYIDNNKITQYKKDKENYFLFNKNEIYCQVFGNISREEFIEIFKGIEIKHK